MKRTWLLALALAATSAAAQQYPTRPITSVVGFAPGGGTDTVSRIVAKTLGEQVGQQVLTDNKAGAGGNIASDHVVRSPADGYTIYLANVGAIAVNPHLLQLTYDPLKDLAPITMAVVFPNLVVVHPRVPAATVEKIRRALVGMADDPAAAATMARVRFKGFAPATDKDYDGVRRVYRSIGQ